MSENIYSTPASNLDIDNNFRGKPTKAIAIGLLISILGSIVGAMIVGISFGIYWSSIGINPEQISSLSQINTTILIAYLIESSIFSVWSGHYVAKKTNYHEYKHCIIMALIGTLIGVLLMVAIPGAFSDQPLWYTIVSYILYPLMVIYGCWLYVKSKI